MFPNESADTVTVGMGIGERIEERVGRHTEQPPALFQPLEHVTQALPDHSCPAEQDELHMSVKRVAVLTSEVVVEAVRPAKSTPDPSKGSAAKAKSMRLPGELPEGETRDQLPEE